MMILEAPLGVLAPERKRRLKRKRAVPLVLVALLPQVALQRQFLCHLPLTRVMQRLRFAVDPVVPAALRLLLVVHGVLVQALGARALVLFFSLSVGQATRETDSFLKSRKGGFLP